MIFLRFAGGGRILRSMIGCDFVLSCALALADEGIRTFRVNILISCALTLADLESTAGLL